MLPPKNLVKMLPPDACIRGQFLHFAYLLNTVGVGPLSNRSDHGSKSTV